MKNVSAAKKAVLASFAGATWVERAAEAFEIFVNKVSPTLHVETELAKNTDVGITIYPPETLVFRALQLCPFETVKVVILGQDPYHDGSATGLAFDNFKKQSVISPSLRRILKKIELETGKPSAGLANKLSYLEHLPGQGVLLLNAALTVRRGEAGSHLLYWREFTRSLLSSLNTLDNVIHIQWGKKAQTFCEGLITNSSHSIIQGAHPSPLAGNSFFDTQYFTNTNIKW